MKRGMKLNRGFLLTIAVLVCVIIFLIVSAVMEATDRAAIRGVVEDYVAREVACTMLPQEYRTEQPDIPAAALDACVADMRSNLSAAYVDNEECYKFLLENLEDSLRRQAKGLESVILSSEKKIMNCSIDLDGNSATVSLTTRTTRERAGNMGDSAPYPLSDSLSLQKVNGVWKLTYSGLSYPDEMGHNGSFGITKNTSYGG